jgi:hypothetical protein
MEKQKHYRQAFEVACQAIQSLDPSAVAARSGADYDESQRRQHITVTFFGDPYTVSFPEIDIGSSRKQTVSLVTRIVLLHYLIRADGSAERGELIPYKEIPGGLMYAGVFERRVTEPLISNFGKDDPGTFRSLCGPLSFTRRRCGAGRDDRQASHGERCNGRGTGFVIVAVRPQEEFSALFH